MKRLTIGTVWVVVALSLFNCKNSTNPASPPAAPDAPVLVSPSNGGGWSAAVPLHLTWDAVSGASSYAVQVSTASNFGTIAFSSSNLTSTDVAAVTIGGPSAYYWRANATNSGGTSNWSGAWSFSIVVIQGLWSTVFEDSFNRADGPIGSNYSTQLYDTTGRAIISGNKLLIAGGRFWAVRYSGAVGFSRIRVSVQCSTTTNVTGYRFAVSGRTANLGGNWMLQEGLFGGANPDSGIAIQRADTLVLNPAVTNAKASDMQTLAMKNAMVGAGKWYFLSLEINSNFLTMIFKDVASGIADTLTTTDTKYSLAGTIAGLNGMQPGYDSIYFRDFKIEKYQLLAQ